MALDVCPLYGNLQSEGEILCFWGSVSQSVVQGIGETLWQRLEMEGTEMTAFGKVFPIFVEQAQNILSHSAEVIQSDKPVTEGRSFFSLSAFL